MKKILNLLAVATLLGTISTNVVACNIIGNCKQKNLNTITKLTGLNIIANPNKKYKELIGNINNFNEFKLKPLQLNYQIKFYDGKNEEITNDNQNLENINKIIVEIISGLNDPNYQGSTKIDITEQTIILDNIMENKIKDAILDNYTNFFTISVKINRKQIVLKTIFEEIAPEREKTINLKLSGLYWKKYNTNFLYMGNEIYDQYSLTPVADNWFENSIVKETVLIKFFYKQQQITTNEFFYPIIITLF